MASSGARQQRKLSSKANKVEAAYTVSATADMGHELL